jgi:DNA-binding response OmpR family regulator
MAVIVRILVVEDHPPLGVFIKKSLENAGYVGLGPALSYAEAMETAQNLQFDLAIIDLLLEGEEASNIADRVVERGIPCIFMSGHPRSRLPERFRDFPFLRKPFAMDALVNAVRAVEPRLR